MQHAGIYEEINQNVIVVGDYKAFNKDNPALLVDVDVKVQMGAGSSA